MTSELTAFLSYTRSSEKLRYWRSVNKQEVDFLCGETLAIKVKSTTKVNTSDFSGLKALRKEAVFKNYVLVSHDLVEALRDGVRCIHWKTFVKELWSGGLTK